jgi:hypothetical protein
VEDYNFIRLPIKYPDEPKLKIWNEGFYETDFISLILFDRGKDRTGEHLSGMDFFP